MDGEAILMDFRLTDTYFIVAHIHALSTVLFLAIVAIPLWLAFRGGGMFRDRDPKHWKLGFLYYNPDTPRLFVAKRSGTPMTVNFARPMAWALILVPVAIALAGLVLTRLQLIR